MSIGEGLSGGNESMSLVEASHRYRAAQVKIAEGIVESAEAAEVIWRAQREALSGRKIHVERASVYPSPVELRPDREVVDEELDIHDVLFISMPGMPEGSKESYGIISLTGTDGIWLNKSYFSPVDPQE